MKTAGKYKEYKEYKNLPLLLKTKDIAEVLGVNYKSALALMKSDAFPSIVMGGSTYRVPKKAFIYWLENLN